MEQKQSMNMRPPGGPRPLEAAECRELGRVHARRVCRMVQPEQMTPAVLRLAGGWLVDLLQAGALIRGASPAEIAVAERLAVEAFLEVMGFPGEPNHA